MYIYKYIYLACYLCLQQVVDNMGNIKFALDTGPDAAGNSWLKYVRSAPSFEEQNLAACHLTGDQVSDTTEMCCLEWWSSRAMSSARGQRRAGEKGRLG